MDPDFETESVYDFVIGTKATGGYYQIDPKVLGIEYSLFLHEAITPKRATFVAETNIPIFRGFNDYGFKEFYVGGEHPDALPKEEFEKLLKAFPTTTEIKKYARARVSAMIRSYVPFEKDFEAEYTKYRGRRRSIKGIEPVKVFAAYESDKFSSLVEKLEAMLKAPDSDYTETRWQQEILQVIQLLYPKYIRAFREAPVRDNLLGKDRKVDFLLVDAAGFVDAIEIKKPFAECLVTSNVYRDNHVPMRELTGTIMQLEKYLFHLNRWGDVGEKKLNERFAGELPDGLAIKIVNPSGMIIFGRDQDLTLTQNLSRQSLNLFL